jgi:hypothetical protein
MIMRILVILLFLTHCAVAQKSDSTQFSVGVTYNTGINYYGRVDSLHSKAFYPFVGVALKNGLYCNANFVFIQNSIQSQYAATLLEVGYNFKGQNGHWAGNISVSKFLYRPDVDLVQSAVKESASASITRLNKIIDVTLATNVKWSNQADFGAQAGLDHIFRIPHIFGEQDVIVLDPSFNAFAGTQNFTETYYQQKNFLIFPVDQQQITTSSRKFNILAYEFSIPLVYGYKQLNIILTPAYVMPQHLLVVPGQPSLSENGANLFYLTATAKITL